MGEGARLRVMMVQPVQDNLLGGPRLARERESVRKWAEGPGGPKSKVLACANTKGRRQW